MKISAPIILSVLACQPLGAAAIIYWDGTGDSTTLFDQAGSGINGAKTSGPTAGTWEILPNGGPSGAGDAYLNLNSGDVGSDNRERVRFTLPTSTLHLQNESWAISGWFNRSAEANNDMIFHFGSGDGFGSNSEFYLYGNATNESVALHNQQGATRDINLSGTATADGTWNSYAVNFTSSGVAGQGTIEFYLNGSLVGTDSTFTMTYDLTQLAYGGMWGSEQEDRNFDGGLDDFAIYDAPLTQDQITGLHNRTLTPLAIPEPSSLFLLSLTPLLARRRRA
ncbi:MAG: LamG domain-containing protein [Verrucomicrobiales bacterium]